jgi:Zn-dependent protease with chaperone function
LNGEQVEKAKAILFGGLAGVAGLLFLRLPWASGPDFDFTGFFWLTENAGKLGLLLLCLVFAATAVSSWIRVYRSG